MNDKEKLIEEMFAQGVLLSQDFLESELTLPLKEKVSKEADLVVLNADYAQVIAQQDRLIDWHEVDYHRVDAEQGNSDWYFSFLQEVHRPSSVRKDLLKNGSPPLTGLALLEQIPATPSSVPSLSFPALPSPDTFPVEVICSYAGLAQKYEVKDFTDIFLSRYRFLESLLRHRPELENILAINRLLEKKEKENVSVIGLVQNISLAKSGNLLVTLEDPSGKIQVVFSQDKRDLFLLGKELVPDEVVGIYGANSRHFLFAGKIVWPEIPAPPELKKGEKEEYAIFLSDIHVGSTLFLKEEFGKFLGWLRGELGDDEQREMAAKVKYIFVVGDSVDGVGVYPSQEEELEIRDIRQQYSELSRLIAQIPSDKIVIISPGNHDVVHLAEPQPIFYKEYALPLFELPNVILVSNPSQVNIGRTETFAGFDVQLYHGYSFDYYVANVDSLRNEGGYRRADLIMKFLLKRRHLAPSFQSTPYFPGYKTDPLLIRKVPDFFVTGHIHYSAVANYKGVTMISGSCWQGKTSFQEKLGHEPEPARVPLVNLKTREVRVLRFI